MVKVFIDGSAGTTGLRIYDRLKENKNITLVTLPDEIRKDIQARKNALNSCDVAFLCLPDAAAAEAVSLIENPDVAVIDTSTAHRTAPGWVYGFPELSGQRDKIAGSKRIANPGCHASGFISLIRPLTEAGVLDKSAKLSCFSLTGYSGGGKKMIAEYEEEPDYLLEGPRVYGLSQSHKHLPEMKVLCGIENEPVFVPTVAPFYSGMEVTVPVFASDLKCKPDELCDVYSSYYKSGVVTFAKDADENGFLSAAAFSGKDSMQLTVVGNSDRILLVSRYDNLGKGASGAAIQNMNIITGLNETDGLVL